MGWIKNFASGIWGSLRGLVSGKRPLCDTCKYDYGNVCLRPERPNALVCPDYKRR